MLQHTGIDFFLPFNEILNLLREVLLGLFNGLLDLLKDGRFLFFGCAK